MIDKSCGYKMASGSESDSGPPSSLCDFLLKMQDMVRLFHRLPAADAREAARELQNVADHLCLATDTAVSHERPGETLSNKGTLSASLSYETRPLSSPLLPPKEEPGLTVLPAAGRSDAGCSQSQWRRQRQGSDCRRRSVKGSGALRKPTSLASEPQAVATNGGGAPANPTALAQQTSLLTSPQQNAILLSTSPANSCSHCGKHFSCAAKLVEHRRTHTGERPFVCHICNRAFSVKSNMTRHVVDTHGLKDAAVGRCGRRARVALGRSDSSGGTGNGVIGDDYTSLPPSMLPSSTQSSVNPGSDEDDQEATDLRKRPAPESPLPQKIARNMGDGDSLTTIHRFNRRKSQPRKLDSVICLLRNSMPCAGDEADDVHTDHSDAGGGLGEDDEGDSGPGCHDRDRSSIVFAADAGATTKHIGMHPFDLDSQRQSASVKPRSVSNGSGRGEELWLSCDRSFRQASPC